MAAVPDPAHLRCTACSAPLCMRGDTAWCLACNVPLEDHPLTLDARETARLVPPTPPDVRHDQNENARGDRLAALERKVAALEARLAAMPTRKGA